MSRMPLATLALAASLGAAAPAGATIVNGSFEDGLPGWSTLGTADVVGGVGGSGGVAAVPPTDGVSQAALVPDDTDPSSTAIEATFDLSAGNRITVDWAFFSDEDPDGGYNDVSFALLVLDDDGDAILLALGDSFGTAFPLAEGENLQILGQSFEYFTGPQSAEIVVPETTIATLLFGRRTA